MKCRIRIACLAIVLGNAVPSLANGQDYLAQDLRGKVERLKTAIVQRPSNNGNARERARTLWQWGNGFAMTGRFIPVNVTSTVNAIMAIPPDAQVPRPQSRALDDFIREFTVRDEQPNALGKVEIDSQGPFVAESFQTIEVTYTVGEMALAEGGVILIGRHFFSDSGRWQRDDSSGANYVSIRSSSPRAKFTNEEVPVRGMHGGFRGATGQMAFRLQETALAKGDTFTVVYGDTSGGGPGYKMQTYSNDAAPLPLYVDFNGDGVYFSLPIPSYGVSGKEIQAIQGFAPSVVAPGEPFDLSIRAEDVYYNRATGAIPKIEVFLNGEPHETLPAGTAALQILPARVLETPGVYRFSFRDPAGTIKGMSNPIWVIENPEWRVYWGDTHGHCGFAEGQGTPGGYFRFGRDDARLDFLTLSEHDIWMDDYEWKQLNDAVHEYTEEGKFILFPGYEWTSRRNRGGHHNVFFRRPGFERVPVQDAPLLTQLFLGLHAKHSPEDVLVIPHAHQLADWRTSDVYLETLVEIMSMHGTFEWFGNRYLQAGRQVGFISASDDHLGHPGYTSGTRRGLKQTGGLAAVMSAELSTDAIFDAMRNRQAYATSGPRIILDVTLNGERMGTRQAFAELRTLKGRVMGTAPIATAELIKNGEIMLTRNYPLQRGPIGTRVFVQVNFESSSESYMRDNPRGYRPWIGTLEVKGATLLNIATPGFQNARSEWARRDWENKNKLAFATATRGRANNMVLELEDASEQTSIRVVLEAGRESGTAPIRVRPFARIPAANLEFDFSDFSEGVLSREVPVGRYKDSLTLQLINPESAFDRAFEFSDSTNPRPGDYYYVRVRQLDGALAWSSPFWVGGEAPQ